MNDEACHFKFWRKIKDCRFSNDACLSLEYGNFNNSKINTPQFDVASIFKRQSTLNFHLIRRVEALTTKNNSPNAIIQKTEMTDIGKLDCCF